MKGCTVEQLVELLPCSKKVWGFNSNLGSFCTEFECSRCACMGLGCLQGIDYGWIVSNRKHSFVSASCKVKR